jgi:hypothetical protein
MVAGLSQSYYQSIKFNGVYVLFTINVTCCTITFNADIAIDSSFKDSRINFTSMPLAHYIFKTFSFSRANICFNQRRFFSSSKPSKEGFTMNKTGKIGLLLLIGGVFLTSVDLYASEKESVQKKEMVESNLSAVMHSKVLDTIKFSQDIPGLKSEEFSALRNEISKTWDTLINNGVLEVSGPDKDIRPYFVALQGVVEHVLASELQKEVTALIGVIHTPMPATPLCSTGDISKELVDPSIESEPSCLFTVKARTTIIRDYLFKGGDLYVVYPKDGLKKRTEEQQKIYQNELANYPTHLFDVPLDCENIFTDLIGATYLFQDQLGKTFIFAIKMTQAKDPKDIGNFGLWFGSIDHPSIQDRIRAVSNYMEQSGSSVLKAAIKG